MDDFFNIAFAVTLFILAAVLLCLGVDYWYNKEMYEKNKKHWLKPYATSAARQKRLNPRRKKLSSVKVFMLKNAICKRLEAEHGLVYMPELRKTPLWVWE